MAKDPICGMAVDEASGLRAERDGQTFYFCSEHCRRTFLAQGTPAGGSQQIIPETNPPATGKYYCPMCAGVVSDTPGACPKCGIPLQSSPGWAAPEKVVYTC
jgi:P-type Cu+ transporter